MSMLFFDQYAPLVRLEKRINRMVSSAEEKFELWSQIEEIVHHRIVGCCLGYLDQSYHNAFLQMLHDNPLDKKIVDFLSEKTKKNMASIIKKEIKFLNKELEMLLM